NRAPITNHDTLSLHDALPILTKKKKLSYLEQKEWESIEDEIAALEAEAEAIEAAINEAGNDIEKVQQLYEAQQEKEQEMEEKMERWEELSLLVEALEE